MLKTVSSITNAIGALNYKGTWNASTNTPTLASGVGTKGDYYVVSVAGSTTLDGISNWGVGDWAAYNGSVWQRVEGGADGNFVNLSVSSTSTLSGLTASTALALDASKNVVSVTNTGTGDNVLATTPTLVGDVTLSTGNVVISTSGKGIAGTTTNDSAAAGVVGEFVSATLGAAPGTALTTSTAKNITSISLTAGDWDVSGRVGMYNATAATWAALHGGISTVSATLANEDYYIVLPDGVSASLWNFQLTVPQVRISIASTTTVYLVTLPVFTGGTGVIGFGSISARRVR